MTFKASLVIDWWMRDLEGEKAPGMALSKPVILLKLTMLYPSLGTFVCRKGYFAPWTVCKSQTSFYKGRCEWVRHFRIKEQVGIVILFKCVFLYSSACLWKEVNNRSHLQLTWRYCGFIKCGRGSGAILISTAYFWRSRQTFTQNLRGRNNKGSACTEAQGKTDWSWWRSVPQYL